MRSDYFNSSHLPDPTAFVAIENVMREERRRKRKRRRRKKYPYPHKSINAPVVRPKIKEVPLCKR